MLQIGLGQYIVLCLLWPGSYSIFTGCFKINIQGTSSETLNGTYEFHDTDQKCNNRFVYTNINGTLYLYYTNNYWMVFESRCNGSGVDNGYLRCRDGADYPTHVAEPWEERLIEIDMWLLNYGIHLECLDDFGLTTSQIILICSLCGVVLLMIIMAALYDGLQGNCFWQKEDVLELPGVYRSTNTDLASFPHYIDTRPNFSTGVIPLHMAPPAGRDEHMPTSTTESDDVNSATEDFTFNDITRIVDVTAAQPPSYGDVISDQGMSLYKSTEPPSYTNFVLDGEGNSGLHCDGAESMNSVELNKREMNVLDNESER